ncbi:MAG TPA: DUF2064 domain-containing protein [Acetobacteraceae bacterium]|nr:DUF2064 domain-containing protein [Acetobacteraceae bacterium]
MTAVAIFVKTPGLTPVKTRLARGIGAAAATEFHVRAASCVAAVARAAMPDVHPYWAVAEQAGIRDPLWAALPSVWQGEGKLGARLHQVYSGLLRRHGAVLLIGADAPQVTPGLLSHVAHALQRGAPCTMGPASDGGFWLFGGRAPVPELVWNSVAYSRQDTGAQLLAALRPFAEVSICSALSDADRPEDLPGLLAALSELAEPLPEQASLAVWLREVVARLALEEVAEDYK